MALAHDDCLDHGGRTACRGEVEYRMLPNAERAFPRGAAHWAERLDRWGNSIERYAHSDIAPDWFDPTIAGERWDDDY